MIIASRVRVKKIHLGSVVQIISPTIPNPPYGQRMFLMASWHSVRKAFAITHQVQPLKNAALLSLRALQPPLGSGIALRVTKTRSPKSRQFQVQGGVWQNSIEWTPQYPATCPFLLHRLSQGECQQSTHRDRIAPRFQILQVALQVWFCPNLVIHKLDEV